MVLIPLALRVFKIGSSKCRPAVGAATEAAFFAFA